MRELLLIRHGATAHNEARLFTGCGDIPLSDAGRAALHERRGSYPPAGPFFTSGMLRAKETLSILYGDVPSIDIPDLRECALGIFEGRDHADLFEHEPAYRAWISQADPGFTPPGGESIQAFEARVLAGWRTLLAHSWQGMAALVAHGGVLSTLFRRLEAGYAGERNIPNGAAFIAHIAPDGLIASVAGVAL